MGIDRPMSVCARRSRGSDCDPPAEPSSRTGFSALLAILLASQLAAADAPKVPTFEADVLPVLNAHCLQCHGGVHQKNGLDHA
jgi:hypothetical protein